MRLIKGIIKFIFLINLIFILASNLIYSKTNICYENKKLKKQRYSTVLNKTLNCVATLVEEQFDGSSSALAGIDILNKVNDRINNKNYKFCDLKKLCITSLSMFKDQVQEKAFAARIITRKQQINYLNTIAKTYPEQESIQNVAKKSLNTNVVCRKAGGLSFKLGFIFTVGLGWEHYTCKTPLGRRFHLMGPSLSSGVGGGLNFDFDLVDNIKFTLPLHSLPLKDETDFNQSAAFLFGSGQSFDPSKQQKSLDISIGIGSHTHIRSEFMLKIKRKPDLNKMYTAMKIKL